MLNFFITKFQWKFQMAENKRIKLMVHWLISQGIIHSQKELGEICGINGKSYLSQLVNGRSIVLVVIVALFLSGYRPIRRLTVS